MKKMKYLSLNMAVMCVCSLGFTSCGDNDDVVPPPSIVIEEANIEGDELCVEADIKAEGRTQSILITITNAQGSTTKVSYPITASKFLGVLNIEGFHVHVPIGGMNVVVGDLMKLTVTDANGNSTTAQKAITEEEDDEENSIHD